jgi:hypothetical protein
MKSVLNADQFLSQIHEVDQGHMTLPLDGKALEYTNDWIGKQFGWPAAPEIRLPRSLEDLVHRLEDDVQLTLGDFVALINLV